MKNILITGANGQLGNEIRNLSLQYPQFNMHFTDVAELDITNEEAINGFIQQHQIDCVVNCAAFTAVDKAEAQPDLCDLLNHKAPGYLAQAIARQGGHIIHISTDYVFNGQSFIPYTEDMPTCPASVYGITKLAGEKAVAEACPSHVIIRTAWLYSTYGNNFVKTMIRLGKEREQLGVVFDQIGTPTYAADLAQAIFHIMEQGITPGIYHFSNEGCTSWYDFTKAIHQLAGISTCRVSPLHTAEYPVPAPRPHYSVLDKTKIKQTYHIDVPYWIDSLHTCINKLQHTAQ